MHRSPTIICAYLIQYGYSMNESIDIVNERRVIASPTPMQREDLKRWEQQVSRKNSMKMNYVGKEDDQGN